MKPASFSTGFHGKLSSSPANSAHFGKTNKLRENQENLGNCFFFSVHKKQRVRGMGGKRQQQVQQVRLRKITFDSAIPAWHMRGGKPLTPPCSSAFPPCLALAFLTPEEAGAPTTSLHEMFPVSFHTPVVPAGLSWF